jgi:epoxyqueuosine reductase
VVANKAGRSIILDIKAQIKKYALDELDIDLVGVAGIDRFVNAPEGHRPTDLLPGSKSVIVMATRLSEGVVQSIFRAYEDGLRHAQCIYSTHGYSLIPNLSLKFASYKMARFLEKKGFITTPLPSGPGGGGAPFSHRHAAVAAGLGEFGWSGILVTPQFGPRVRLVSVITRAEIEPDPMLPGGTICDSSKCNICVNKCPTGAISATKSKTATMGKYTYEYGYVDFPKCRVGSEGLLKKTLGLKDLDIPENPTLEDVDKARLEIHPRQLQETNFPVDRATWYCGKCSAYCPIGQSSEFRKLHR